MRAIGFGYQKRTGKDTACRFAISYMKQEYPHVRCCRKGFSNAIKDLAQRAYGWGGLADALYYEQHPEEMDIVLAAVGKTPRQIWDAMGTLFREICPKTWNELLFADLDTDIVFIDGVRFPTEIEYIRGFDGKVYKMVRDSAPKSENVVDHALDSYTGWDGTIENNGTLRELNTKVVALVDSIMEEWGYAKRSN